jgi:hypothetical protein
MKTIKILPVKEYEDECKLRREINPILPNCKGDVGLLVGRIASGKSVTLSNILLRKELLGDLFGTIHLISNTAGNDDTSRFLVNSDNVIVYDSYSDDIIRDINDIKKEQEKKDMEWDIIVGDDLLGSLRSNPPCLLYQFCTRLRHTCFNMMLLTQKMKAVPPVVRANCSYMLVFWNNYSDNELDDIENEFGSFCGEKGFKYYYKKYIQKSPYSFLYMNFVKGLVMKNFEKILYRVEKNNNDDSENEEEKTEV